MKLKPCPNTANCVCSQNDTGPVSQQISPLSFQCSAEEALQGIKDTILSFPRVRLLKQDNYYLHFEFTSLLFRFVDDLEVLIDVDKKVIHFRSASRCGYSDLGVNRRRIEKIKQKYF